MDVSAQVTMKDAAKCDRRCEWQNSANQENVERILHFQISSGSTSGSGPLALNVFKMHRKVRALFELWNVFECQRRSFRMGAYRWRFNEKVWGV